MDNGAYFLYIPAKYAWNFLKTLCQLKTVSGYFVFTWHSFSHLWVTLSLDSHSTIEPKLELAWAVSVPVGRYSGGRLATTLVATINNIIFFHQHLFWIQYYCRPRIFWPKILLGPNNRFNLIFFIGTSVRRSRGRRSAGVVWAVDCWQQCSGHYLHQSFFPPVFFFSVVTFSHRRSAQIKKLILRKLLRMPKT